MRLFAAIFFPAAVFGSLDIIKTRELTHDDVGAYHTLAFDMLGEKYAGSMPKDHIEVIADLCEILISFCGEGDLNCAQDTRNAIFTEYTSGLRGDPNKMNYPEGFHPLLAEKLDIMESAIKEIDEFNIDEIVDSLTILKEQTDELQDIDEVHKTAALTAFSVAIESSKLWHSVYFDEDHPLNFRKENTSKDLEQFDGAHRRSQSIVVVFRFDSVIADVKAAFNYILTPINTNPLNTALLAGLFVVAIPMSVTASLVTFLIGQGAPFFLEWSLEDFNFLFPFDPNE